MAFFGSPDLHGQANNYGPWNTVHCFDGLDYAVKRNAYNEFAKKYEWRVKFRNRYNVKIHFGVAVKESNVTSANSTDRFDLAPGAETSQWFLVADGNSVRVFIDRFRFGDNDAGPYASCGSTSNGNTSDHSNNTLPGRNDEEENSTYQNQYANAIGQPQETARTNQLEAQERHRSEQLLQQQEEQRRQQELAEKRRMLNERLNEANRRTAAAWDNFNASLSSVFDQVMQNMFENSIRREAQRRQEGFEKLQELVTDKNGTLTNCTYCSGQGFETCGSCSGSGKKTCMSCFGKGRATCTVCYGTGKYFGNTCSACGGGGSKECLMCKGAGATYCTACHATGKDFCDYCDGTGQQFKEESPYSNTATHASLGHASTPSYRNASEVVIGRQVWATKNCVDAHFRNGDPIVEAKTDEDWKNALRSRQPAWCYYKNDADAGAKVGKLYNYFAVHDERGLCPSGWHIPSQVEWIQCTTALGVEQISKSGFPGLPGGYRDAAGWFGNMGSCGYWWSLDNSNDEQWALVFKLSCPTGMAEVNKGNAAYVRCIKD